ncbi:serine/threonine protein kinase [Xenococcus sp. PCC 7305]|uniref:serine/threonine-protein kinase n=1 Tax=Xenococcus sp. PCC 7305 TaxID=102125 RepID=UPI0002ACB4D6|nr:serine/threonine-protein kinase [Xenococcus sp. PCC 7305]ELS04712.1 serine/threonine protein kinase [Xenococcus sp. PCC 7305]
MAILNKLLGGHYRVVQNLEEGGLAKTYIAEDHHRPGHPKCAVKLLKPASNKPGFLPTARRLFRQEAEVLEKLGQHPQIPRLLAYFEENREFYLVQEFIEGHTLTKELPRSHCWAESKVIQMLEEVLLILEFVHGYGVIHRDIKPNNLIRRQKDGRLVLIDFGAVKQVSAPQIGSNLLFSHKTVAIGTQGYMPTEQIRGKPRLNSDIYALGMLGIQALTGVYPVELEEDAEGEVIWQDKSEVSGELAAILNKMTRYHFKDRYQSVAEVLEQIHSLTKPQSLTQSNLVTVNLELVDESEIETQEIETQEIETQEIETQEIEQQMASTRIEASVIGEQKAVPKTELWKTKLLISSDSSVPSAGILVPKKIGFNYDCASLFVRLNKSRLLIGTGMMSVLVGILAGFNYINNNHLAAERALTQIENLKTQGKYQECWQQALKFSQDYSSLQTIAADLQSQCYQSQAELTLIAAKDLAEQSNLKDAIALAAQVPEDANLYSQAQQLMSQWADKMLEIASNKYQEGNLQLAIAIAEAVPALTPTAEKVEATIAQWEEEWQKNTLHLQTAQQKLSEGRWQDAIKEAQQLSNTDYWQKQGQPIIDQAKAKIIAAQKAAAKANNRVTTSPRKQTSNRQTVNRSRSVNSSRSANQSRPITISKPIDKTRQVNKSGSANNSNSNPRYTSKMTCKYIGDHPKCPR